MKKFTAVISLLLFMLFSANAQNVTLSGPGPCGAAAVSGNWIVPCNVTSITVEVYGGGGGAGGGGGGSNGGFFNTRGGGGGGGGGYTTITINVVPGSSFSYTIGSGGCGGSNGSDGNDGGNGTNGGSSTFNGTAQGGGPVNLTANGGTRGTGGDGTNGSTGSGGAGGSASGGSTNTTGNAGNNGSGGTGGNGGAGAGPAGGAGGVANGGNGNAYGGGGAGGGDSPGGRGAAGVILITYNTVTALPPVPTVSTTPPSCGVDGVSTITNYNAIYSYIFSPLGPTAGAGGIISGTTPGTNYTVMASDGNCNSAASSSFSIAAALPVPGTPTVTTVPASCTANGTSTVDNYNVAMSYIVTPVGPTVGAGGAISGMILGINYTVEVNNGTCTSAPSAQFSNGAQLPSPTTSISGTLTYCTGSNTTLTATGGPSYSWTDAGMNNIGNTASVTVTQGTYTVMVTNGSNCTATATATVTQQPGLNVSISGNLSYCAGGNTTITASGGNTYLWNDAGSSTTASITVTQGGYIVTVTDANFCTGTASVAVTQNSLPVVSISGTLNYCQGGNTTITASGASTYLWNDQNNSATAGITVTQGAYTVTGTDANNCTATASATVIENALPVVSISGSLTYCTGGNTALTASGASAYLWSNAATSAAITVTQGTYSVTGTDGNFCTASASVNVTQSNTLSVTITGTLTHCPGANTTITANGGTGFLWNDANNSTTSSITVTQGTYSVTATDITGCTGTASATVTQLTPSSVSVSGTLNYCQGANTIITASGASTYSWNDAGNSTTAAITVTQGTYTVTGTDANNCTATASATVIENTLPVVSISGSLTYCTGGTTTLTASGGNIYLWSNAATTATVAVTQGTYTVTGTDGNGCTATASVNVTQSTTLTVTISGALSYCPGSNTTLTASGGVNYIWSTGAATASITATQGSHSVTATDAACSGTSSAVVTQFVTTPVNLGSNITACDDSVITIDAGSGFTSYAWGGGEITQTIQPQYSGAYSVTVVDANTCTTSGSVSVVFNPCVVIVKDYSLYIPTAFSPNGDGANDVFRATAWLNLKQFSLRVFNRWGEKVFETIDITEGWDGFHKGVAQPLASYIWHTEYTFDDGKKRTQSGNVTLVR